MRLLLGNLMRTIAAMTLVLAAVVGCGPARPEEGDDHGTATLQPVPLEEEESLRVVATTNIVGDIVGQVGGDRIELTTLMGTGVDPHGFVPTPSSSAAIYDAHVVFLSGAGLEASLEEMIDEAGGSAVHVDLSEGLDLLEAPGHLVREDDEAGDDEEEGETGPGEGTGTGGHGHGDRDPHVWFSVPNVIAWVDRIEGALSALDPDAAQAYAQNAQAYAQELEALDAWVMDQVASIPEANRKLVTNHPAFVYLADRYGLEQVGAVYPVSPSSEPSAQDIAALQDAIREYGVPAVFTESTVNPKLAEQVASDTGVSLVSLYTGSVGEPGSGAETYMLLIRYNVEAIVEALR
jgi:ABC-type Zn uptake system ZnuABC Zn-binding protein ZnuA